MPRPETFEDLPEHARRPILVGTIEPAAFMAVSAPMVRALADLLAVARQEGLTVSGHGAIHMPLTDEMKAKALAGRQETWDRRQALYERAVSAPWSLGPWDWGMVEDHAREEGLPVVEPPTEEEQDG